MSVLEMLSEITGDLPDVEGHQSTFVDPDTAALEGLTSGQQTYRDNLTKLATLNHVQESERISKNFAIEAFHQFGVKDHFPGALTREISYQNKTYLTSKIGNSYKDLTNCISGYESSVAGFISDQHEFIKQTVDLCRSASDMLLEYEGLFKKDIELCLGRGNCKPLFSIPIETLITTEGNVYMFEPFGEDRLSKRVRDLFYTRTYEDFKILADCKSYEDFDKVTLARVLNVFVETFKAIAEFETKHRTELAKLYRNDGDNGHSDAKQWNIEYLLSMYIKCKAISKILLARGEFFDKLLELFSYIKISCLSETR